MGAAIPRYIQRRRGVRAATAGDFATFNHQAWGWGWRFRVDGAFHWDNSGLWLPFGGDEVKRYQSSESVERKRKVRD